MEPGTFCTIAQEKIECLSGFRTILLCFHQATKYKYLYEQGGEHLFSLEYEDWECICSQIFIQKHGRKKIYLQWYPFACLSNHEKKVLMSKEFFGNFIQTGIFLYYPENWLVADNYMMKGDGNFRNASLISPIMYLLALAIGKNISKKYVPLRPLGVQAFYAGNFQENRLYYSKDYDVFFKTLNDVSQSYQYFIKTDIKNFFSNININLLFEMIDHILKKAGNVISLKDSLIYKEILVCMGQGEFPLVENSTVSSYLATIVYLDQADTKLHNYIQSKETGITEFFMVRYVDDLYILFNSQIPERELMPVVNRILSCYSSELKRINLTLNRGKTSWKRVSELNDEVKKSLYDEQIKGKKFIDWHMKTSGCNVEIFTSPTKKAIYRRSQGIPRMINRLALECLNEACLEGERLITEELFARVCKNLGPHLSN